MYQQEADAQVRNIRLHKDSFTRQQATQNNRHQMLCVHL